MKHLKYRVLIGILAFTFTYLLGSFSEASFNILLWGERARFIVALLGGIGTVAFVTYPDYNFKE